MAAENNNFFSRLAMTFLLAALASATIIIADARANDFEDLVLPRQVADENWPCEYKGYRWHMYPERIYPKYGDRKGELKTFAYTLKGSPKNVTGYMKTCVYKVVDKSVNRYLQALERRVEHWGPYHIWRSDGLMVESGQRENGLKVGTIIQFDEKGNVGRTIEYKKGLKHGKVKYLTVTGNRCEDSYSMGRMHRHECYFGDSQNIWKTETYVSGVKHGKAISYQSPGILDRIESWEKGKLNGPYVIFKNLGDRHAKYSVSFYEEGEKRGLTRIFSPDGERLR